MTWERFYKNLYGWDTKQWQLVIEEVEEFGSPKEVINAIEVVGWDDEEAADALLVKALKQGVTFSGEGLTDLFLDCEGERFMEALECSAQQFTAQDLEELEGLVDEDILIGIAKKHRIPLPECLKEDAYEDNNDRDVAALDLEVIYEAVADMACDTAYDTVDEAVREAEERKYNRQLRTMGMIGGIFHGLNKDRRKTSPIAYLLAVLSVKHKR